MIIYVKDNVERIAGDEATAKKLEAKGFKKVTAGKGPVIASQIPAAIEKPAETATKNVQRRRRSQRSKATDITTE